MHVRRAQLGFVVLDTSPNAPLLKAHFELCLSVEYLPVLFLVGIYICFLSVFCNEYPIMNNGVKCT